MIRNPLRDEATKKPQLNDEEEFLCVSDLCSIEIEEKLQCNGSFYVSNQRLIWMSKDNDESCYSFSALMSSLMVHALCKNYIFLQIENQESEIKIMHKSYEELQKIYESLCEGQRLNPCENDSSDDGDNALMSFGNDGACNNDEMKSEKKMKDWESKLVLKQGSNMINNKGYLERAEIGQFEDADVDKSKNPYIDENLMKGLNQFSPTQNKSFEEKFTTFKVSSSEETKTENEQ